MVKGIYFLIVLLCTVQTAFADTIEFKSGRMIEGIITQETDDYIMVDDGSGVSLTYFLEDIKRIDREPINEQTVKPRISGGSAFLRLQGSWGVDFPGTLEKLRTMPDYSSEEFEQGRQMVEEIMKMMFLTIKNNHMVIQAGPEKKQIDIEVEDSTGDTVKVNSFADGEESKVVFVLMDDDHMRFTVDKSSEMEYLVWKRIEEKDIKLFNEAALQRAMTNQRGMLETDGVDLSQSARDSQIALAKSALRALSTALETYATANNGLYASDMNLLVESNPPYINENYCDSTHANFVYHCDLTAKGYFITASDGNSQFSISTGGVLSVVSSDQP